MLHQFFIIIQEPAACRFGLAALPRFRRLLAGFRQRLEALLQLCLPVVLAIAGDQHPSDVASSRH